MLPLPLPRSLAPRVSPSHVLDAHPGSLVPPPPTGNLTQLAEYYTRHPVPQRFSPGIVVASIIVSALGSYSTLLLLSKRTSNRGFRNFAWLVGSALTQMAVGIWGMHFIGMHMTLRPQDGVSWYMHFNGGWTVFSLFVPLVALATAFFFVTVNSLSYVRVVFSGVTTGGIIALMHYSASFKTNFDVHYKAVHVVFSIVLACLSATVALFTFFRLRAQWADSWWKRGMCALVLATGVSSMHYLGQSGTSFYVPKEQHRMLAVLHTNDKQSVSTAIAIGAMCAAIVFTCFLLTMSDLLSAQAARERARKIVVCSATFDKQGRLLVKPDGTVPMVVIESDIQPKDMLHYLDRRQPLFQWLYAISWDWGMVLPFVRSIDARFRRQQPDTNSIFESTSPLRRWLGIKPKPKNKCPDEDDKAAGAGPGNIDLGEFKDRYIAAAHELSCELAIPMENAGVLYDRVFPNGSLLHQEQQHEKKRTRHNRKASKAARNAQDEKADAGVDGFDELGRDDQSTLSSGPVSSVFNDEGGDQEGLLLFLVREVGNGDNVAAQDELSRYEEKGYRMTETRFLTKVLSDRLSVPKPDMTDMLNALKLYSKRGTRPVVQPGGVYVGMFGVRPTTSVYGGLDVLTYGFAKHMIPAFRVPDVPNVTLEMRAFMRVLDQMSLDEAMRTCERESIRSGERRQYLNADGMIPPHAEEELIQFQMALFLALDALANAMSFYPRIAQSSRLSAELLEVPSSLDDSTPPAQMILVQAVLPSEDAAAHPYGDTSAVPDPDTVPTETSGNGTPFVFVPYTLFAKAQMMLLRGQQADEFEDEVTAELRRRHPNMLMAGGEYDGAISEYGGYGDSEDTASASSRRNLTSRGAMRHPLATLAAATGMISSTAGGSDGRSGRSGGRSGKALGGLGSAARSRSRSGYALQSVGDGTGTGTGGGGASASRRTRSRAARARTNPETYELTSRLRFDGGAGSGAQGTASAQIAQQWAAKEGSQGQGQGQGLGLGHAATDSQGSASMSEEKISEEQPRVQVQVTTTTMRRGHDHDQKLDEDQELEHTLPATRTSGSGFGYRPGSGPGGGSGAGGDAFIHSKSDSASTSAAGEAALHSPRTTPRVQIVSPSAFGDRTERTERDSVPLSERGEREPSSTDITSGRSGRSGWSNRSARRGRAPELDLPPAATEPNEASLRARFASDDWSARQLESLGRGPAGPLLLGVDY